MRQRWLSIIVLIAGLVTTLDAWAETTPSRAVGGIGGAFDVTLSASASYTIPIRSAPGTAGVEPKVSLVYDSQAPAGPLGAGWAISGISVITRGPKNARDDGIPDGVRLSESDALYLDGQRLVPISVAGSGSSRRIEYRKQNDDQTRVLELGADFATATFQINTKGGLTIQFDTIAGQSADKNRGDIHLADGSVLLRSETRVIDSSGNYMDFYYLVNQNGNYDISSIHYTGHLDGTSGNTSSGRAPYAVMDFHYRPSPRQSTTFVAGQRVVRDTQLEEISTRVSPVPEDDQGVTWQQVARYTFKYEDRDTANRFVLAQIDEFDENGLLLNPTKFTYSAPEIGWSEAPFQFPNGVILGGQENLGAGYRFGHFSSDNHNLPDLLLSVQVAGKLESFAFQNTGPGWSAADPFKPPIPFNADDGSDLGVVVTDVTGNGRVALLQNLQAGHSYLAGDTGWIQDDRYGLPFVVSAQGKVVAQYRMAKWTGGPGPDLLYQSGSDSGMLINTANGWQLKTDAAHKPPLDLRGAVWTVDVDCSGSTALIGAATDGDGRPVWRVFKFGAQGWEEAHSDALKFPFPASTNPEAVRMITIDQTGCPAVLVATAHQGVHGVYQASSSGWRPITEKTPPFDLVDDNGIASGALTGSVSGSGLSDVFAHMITMQGQRLAFLYFQTATGWQAGPASSIPILNNSTSRVPIHAFVGDLEGDGHTDIALAGNSRHGFGQVFLGTAQGFTEQPDFVPPVAFAQKDQQDNGVRIIDFDGDGLPDLLVSRTGAQSPAAFRNTGKGWDAASSMSPPVAFAGNDISGNPAQFVDVDGDGFLDILYSYRDKNGNTETHFFHNVAAADGTRRWSDVTTESPELKGLVPPSAYPYASYKIGDMGVRFADVAGNGRPYMLVGFQPSPDSSGHFPAPIVAAFRNDGQQWVQDDSYKPPIAFVMQLTKDGPSRDLGVQLIDVNGDGLPDIVAYYHDPQNLSQLKGGVWLNTGHGWSLDQSFAIPVALDGLKWDPSQGLVWDTNSTVQWTDLNGDGLPDIIYTKILNGSNLSVTYINTAKGWISAPEWQVPLEVLAERGGDPGLRLIDVNGDGYPDLVYARSDANGLKEGLYVNTGAGWKKTPDPGLIAFVDKDGNDLGVRLLDVDGRGVVDIVSAYAGSLPEIKLNKTRRSDVIAAIDSGDGIKTSIFYQTFLEQAPPDGIASPNVPLWGRVYQRGDPTPYPIVAPVPATYAVRRVLVDEGPGRQIPFSYRYGDFRMDALAKRSLGFGWRESLNEVNLVLTRMELSQDVRTTGKQLREFTCALIRDSRPPGENLATNACTNAAKTHIPWVRPLTDTTNTWIVEELQVGGGPLAQHLIRQVSLASSTSTTYELDGGRVEWHTDRFTYDEPLGQTEPALAQICAKPPQSLVDRRMNLLKSVTTRGDGSSTTTVNEYCADDEAKWYLGRLTKSTVTKAAASVPQATGPPVPPEIREVGFSYDKKTGLLASETVNLGTDQQVTTSYDRDAYGNIIKKMISPIGLPESTSITVFDNLGRFATKEINPLHQETVREYSRTTGLPERVIDPNGDLTRYEYDGVGRLHRVYAPTGLITTTDYISVSDISPSIPVSDLTSAVYIRRTITGSATNALPPKFEVLDAKGRLLRTITNGFSAIAGAQKLALQDTEYDLLGQVRRKSLPYEAGQTTSWKVIERDVLGRVRTQTTPAGATARTEYQSRPEGGGVMRVTDPLGHTTTTVSNMHKLPVRVIDAAGGVVSYEYDAGDRPVAVVDPIGAVTHYGYKDSARNRTDVQDPDLGSWHYEYDALGRLVTQADGNTSPKNVTMLQYDVLGRVVREIRPKETWIWTYDASPHGIGKIASVRKEAGSYIRDLVYDRYGREVLETETINGEQFNIGQDYDELDRVKSVYYPEGFVAINEYDNNGFFVAVKDGQSGKTYWKAEAIDTFGHVIKETLGNGVQGTKAFNRLSGRPEEISAFEPRRSRLINLKLKYDLAGNLLHREESEGDRSETLTYDVLDRIQSRAVQYQPSEHYRYDAAGRITFKSGVGSYAYSRRPTEGAKFAPAHGVARIEGPDGETDFAYDSHGNLVQKGDQTFTYSADNRLTRVVHDQEHWTSFDYDADGQRYRQVSRQDFVTTESIVVGGYERITEFGVSRDAGLARFVRHRWYLANTEGVFAAVESSVENFPPTVSTHYPGAAWPLPQYPYDAAKTWYLHKDQLGSIIAISDEKGTVAARYWYDPWGKREAQINDPWGAPSGKRLESSWRRGFIGQEHVHGFQLIHLNGRVYDPGIGQFVSVDPLNQAPLDTQIWDGYSYARNNPLRYIDPSGYSWFSNFIGSVWHAVTAPVRAVGNLVGAAAQAVGHAFEEAGKWVAQNWRQVVIVAAVVAVSVVTGGAGTIAGAILAGMEAGATAGALGAALYGGSLDDVLVGAIKGGVIGGLSGGALYGIGTAAQLGQINDVEAVAGHGVVGGLREAAEGGNFLRGFASGALTKVTAYGPTFDSTDLNIARAAVVGGTVAAVDGGKFANGAVTGAFSYAFNDALHPPRDDAIYPTVSPIDFAVGAAVASAAEAVISGYEFVETALVTSGGAADSFQYQLLKSDLGLREMFTETGELTEGAISNSRMIIDPADIGNPNVPTGLGKFTTQTFNTPSGPAQVHYYMNPLTGASEYGLDYKTIFTKPIGVP